MNRKEVGTQKEEGTLLTVFQAYLSCHYIVNVLIQKTSLKITLQDGQAGKALTTQVR